jgi:hypothetical protein
MIDPNNNLYSRGAQSLQGPGPGARCMHTAAKTIIPGKVTR